MRGGGVSRDELSMALGTLFNGGTIHHTILNVIFPRFLDSRLSLTLRDIALLDNRSVYIHDSLGKEFNPMLSLS
jgi:hypothetical protein